MLEQSEIEIRKTIESLIHVATSFNIDQLEMIYHNDMQDIMINGSGKK